MSEIYESPLEQPPNFWVADYVDEDGTLIPGHEVDMSQIRRQIFELVCPCGRTHGLTVDTSVQITRNPQLYAHFREVAHRQLRHRVESDHTES